MYMQRKHNSYRGVKFARTNDVPVFREGREAMDELEEGGRSEC